MKVNSESLLGPSEYYSRSKNASLGLNTAYKNGLSPKFEEKPRKGQNEILTMFLHNIACPFHSATESAISSNIIDLVKIAILRNFGNCQFRNYKKCTTLC